MSKQIKPFLAIMAIMLCCVFMTSCNDFTLDEKDDLLLDASTEFEENENGVSIADIRKGLPLGHIAAGATQTVGLRADGTVVVRGFGYGGETYEFNWTDIVAVATMGANTMGLRADGTVAVDIERNHKGQCDVSDWTDIVAISMNNAHTVGLKSDGTVVATGELEDIPHQVVFNEDMRVVEEADTVGFGRGDVSGWTDIVAVATGNQHTVGLKSDGTVLAVGENLGAPSGPCNVSEWEDIVAIAAGAYHTIGLQSNGRVVATGNEDYGRCDVSGWRNIVAIAAGGSHTVGLRADGRVVAVGYSDYGQCDVGDWRDIVAIAAGNDYTVGIKADGSVVAVGDNSGGQCDLWDWNLAVKPFTQNITSVETAVNEQSDPFNDEEEQSNIYTSDYNDVYYRGQPLASFVGFGLERLSSYFGEPIGGTHVDGSLYSGGEYVVYEGGVIFVLDGDAIAWILGPTSAIDVNGVTLDKSREEIIELLGIPDIEENVFDDMTEEYVYYMTYYQEVTDLLIELPDADSKSTSFVISRVLGVDD